MVMWCEICVIPSMWLVDRNNETRGLKGVERVVDGVWRDHRERALHLREDFVSRGMRCCMGQHVINSTALGSHLEVFFSKELMNLRCVHLPTGFELGLGPT